MVVDSSGASASSAAVAEVWPNSNGNAHHYDVASAWMDNDAASEELHRYSSFFESNLFFFSLNVDIRMMDEQLSGLGCMIRFWKIFFFWVLYKLVAIY